ncbi:MAG: gamma-glutamyl-gamma-aminobutyrate hydrolase family protein [Xanthomonadaceae bacterium]|nr:gamma-glutamyl-gamma-aminobutyrate hydrolase family protein [Xanthomonadaceae bacterium]MDP2184191.1 gamma-glutamyl-gamma-aminobutyrate hydrolase family protein [Xanthomonadales bacterium]MDZ4114736.1 gamma-glutamyl-gamma-aminobutyrate hydrolase family protein [Xanthomonadaceae bacterium]MDZ4379035.1 gamma-glutamyl-gamma-aminobutyrate hydrolase family protein [Xanthomonadaceae bacterium]
MHRAPLIGLPSDRKMVGVHPFHCVGEKYISAAVVGAEALPVLLPSLQPALDWAQLLDRLDGLIFTGAPSNIEPQHYSDESSYEGNLHDPARDANTLGLVRLAIAHKLPILALCRGFQEVNVALGGSLYQKVHEQPGFNDHRENKDDPLDQQYAPSHLVHLAEGGVLRQLAGSDSVMVNSLHGQGIRTLAPGLAVEATAPDGLIEAIRLDRADTFVLAVQWHPEWKVALNPFYLAIFHAFADACRQRMNQRV